MGKLTKEEVLELTDSCNMGIGDAITEYHALTRKLRVEENPDGLFGFLTTVLQKGAEAGEVQGKIAKSLRDDPVWRGLTIEKTNDVGNVATLLSTEHCDAVIKELGDDLFYISEMCNHLGITLFDLMIDNIEKLASRDSRGALQGAGDNR